MKICSQLSNGRTLGELTKYPDLFTVVRQINNDENLESILINEEELVDIYERETRLFGFFDLDGKLYKITQLSLSNSTIDSVDYYFSSDILIYVIEVSNFLTKNLEVESEEIRYSKYVFEGGRISDYERVGNYGNLFDKQMTEENILNDTTRNVGLLAKKWTER